jgi:hypothetical protein
MPTAPGSNERMDYLSPTPSLSDFGIHLSLGEGAARQYEDQRDPHPPPVGHFFLAAAPATTGRQPIAPAKRAHELPWWRRRYQIRARPAWPLKHQRKRALVNLFALNLRAREPLGEQVADSFLAKWWWRRSVGRARWRSPLS